MAAKGVRNALFHSHGLKLNLYSFNTMGFNTLWPEVKLRFTIHSGGFSHVKGAFYAIGRVLNETKGS